MSRVNIAVLLGATAALVVESLTAIQPAEDVELRDLDVTPWNCSNKDEGTAQSQAAKDRNRMKNRWSVNLSGFAIEYLDTASFLKKVREYDSLIQGKHRGDFYPFFVWYFEQRTLMFPLRISLGVQESRLSPDTNRMRIVSRLSLL